MQKIHRSKLLIDARETEAGSNAKALTIDGLFSPIIDESQKENIRNKMLKSFRHMKKFIHHPESDLIRIRIKSFLLLNGLTDSHFASL